MYPDFRIRPQTAQEHTNRNEGTIDQKVALTDRLYITTNNSTITADCPITNDTALFDDGEAIGKLYQSSVPMGGELTARPDTAPSFIAWAVGDASSAPLQRLQIIKGWEKDGETYEQVYDVACSDGQTPDPDTHRCGDNGARCGEGRCNADGRV